MQAKVDDNIIVHNVTDETSSSGQIARSGVWQALGLGLILRLVVPIVGYVHTHDIKMFYSPDTVSYVVPAQELVANHRFFANGVPEIKRTPGYPMLLTIGLLLGRLELVTILLQILLSCFTIYMVYLTAWLLFKNRKVSIVAATLYAMEPLSIMYTSQLLTETLFAALVMIWLYFLLKYLEKQAWRDLLVSALALAFSVYVRPVGYFLPVMLAGGLAAWAVLNGQKNKGRLLTQIAAFLILSMGLTVGWQVRNRMETGYSGFSGIPSIDMYFYLAASVLASQQHVPLVEMQRRLGYLDDRTYLERHPEQKTWPLAQRLDYMKREGQRILLNNLPTYALIYLVGVRKVVFETGAGDFLKFLGVDPNKSALSGKDVKFKSMSAFVAARSRIFWSDVLLLPLELLYLLLGCVVLCSRRLMREPALIAAVLTVAYYVVLAGSPMGYSRFRHPVMPIICMLSAYGLCLIETRVAIPRVSPFFLPTGTPKPEPRHVSVHMG